MQKMSPGWIYFFPFIHVIIKINKKDNFRAQVTTLFVHLGQGTK